MPAFWTPARRRGVEILDDPAVAGDVRHRAMADVARANRLFGGTRAVRRGLRDVLARLSGPRVLLDLGTGAADIAASIRQDAARRGLDLFIVALDVSEDLARAAKARSGATALVANGLRLPLRDASVDVVVCSQVLHHFAEPEARTLVGEMHRVSRGAVVVADLRRSWLAAGGFWLASLLLRFHPVTRADGVVSVFRGFTRQELEAIVHDSTGTRPRMFTGAFWRVGAVWTRD